MNSSWSARFCGICIGILLLCVGSLQTAAAQAVITYANNPNTVIIKFEELFGELGDMGRGPLLEVYADGRVSVYYPPYMKRAGKYQLQLTQVEMESLLQIFSAHNIPDFDVAAVRQSRNLAATAQEASSGMLFASTDPSTTILELHLDQYVPAWPPGQKPLAVHQRIVWQGLRADAQRFPELAAIQNLFTAQQELRALMEHPALEQLDAEEETR